MKQINQLGTEKTIPDNDDVLPIQQADGISRHITRGNFLAGIGTSGGGSKYIQLLHKLSSGSGAGSSSSGWNDRPVNTIAHDDTSLVTLSSNQFVLPSGSYVIDSKATFYKPYEVQLRLYNHTDNAVIVAGLGSYTGNYDLSVNSFLSGWFSVGSNKSLAIQYRVNNPQGVGYALGVPCSFGIDEVFLIADIYKVG